jgi:hypothetical protein
MIREELGNSAGEIEALFDLGAVGFDQAPRCRAINIRLTISRLHYSFPLYLSPSFIRWASYRTSKKRWGLRTWRTGATCGALL